MNKRARAALMWVRARHGGSPETPQEGAWVEHDGDVSKAPPADSTTEVVFRDGSTDTGRSGEAAWDWCDDDTDVMRWRYV